MLEIVRYNEEEYDFPCLLVLGCFDGLHIGHAELLKKAKLQAKINGLDLGVMLFTDGKGGKYLYSFEERVKFLEQYNVKFVLKIDFDDEFKKIKPLDFLACLEDKLNIKAYMSGKDFRFGQGKKGKASTLKSYAEDEDNGVWYMSVKEVSSGDEKVSTTRVKALLEVGDVKSAAELLGRNYSVCGTVIKGADRGGKLLGYPTMNIAYPEEKFEVKSGVYKVRCSVGGNDYFGIANYGARPTFGENNALLEVHLDGLEGLHYDETVTVEFINYLRDICKFDDAEALAAQLAKDMNCLGAEAELAVADETEPVTEPVAEEAQPDVIAVEPETDATQTELATDAEPKEEVSEVAEVEHETEIVEEQPVDEQVEEPADPEPAVEEAAPVDEPAPQTEPSAEVAEEEAVDLSKIPLEELVFDDDDGFNDVVEEPRETSAAESVPTVSSEIGQIDAETEFADETEPVTEPVVEEAQPDGNAVEPETDATQTELATEAEPAADEQPSEEEQPADAQEDVQEEIND